jgi:hypothetical protein
MFNNIVFPSTPTGKDYNEFRAFVSCSHLNPVQSKQMKELLQSGTAGATRDRVTRLQYTDKKKQLSLAAAQPVESKLSAPGMRKTTRSSKGEKKMSVASFERDWRRNCPVLSRKFDFLMHTVTPSAFASCEMFGRTALDPAIMSDIIHVVAWSFCRRRPKSADGDGGSAPREAEERSDTMIWKGFHEASTKGEDAQNVAFQFSFRWMEALTKCERFGLNLSFMPSDTINEVLEIMSSLKAAAGDLTSHTPNDDSQDVDRLAAKYSD